MPASAHPSIKVKMVLIENPLAVLFIFFCGMTQLYIEMFIPVDDSVYRH